MAGARQPNIFMFDLIIIGGSIAGTTAAVYASRRKLNFKLVSADLGGEVALSGEIENWPGVNHTDGFTLAGQLAEQLKYNSVPTEEGFTVTSLEQNGKTWRVVAKNLSGEERVYETRAVIVATGVKPKHLGVAGEDALYSKGVTYCTVCDGPLYKGKVTATIGGGNSALESGLMMAKIASKVFVVNKNAFFKGDQILIEKLSKEPNVEIIYEARTQKITGETNVTGVTYTDKNGAEQTIAVQGVMVHIGNIPNTQFVPADLALDNFKQIIVDARGATNLPGLFAAGDVAAIPYKQIVIAAGMGCNAALSAIEYINRFEN